MGEDRQSHFARRVVDGVVPLVAEQPFHERNEHRGDLLVVPEAPDFRRGLDGILRHREQRVHEAVVARQPFVDEVVVARAEDLRDRVAVDERDKLRRVERDQHQLLRPEHVHVVRTHEAGIGAGEGSGARNRIGAARFAHRVRVARMDEQRPEFESCVAKLLAPRVSHVRVDEVGAGNDRMHVRINEAQAGRGGHERHVCLHETGLTV